MAKKVQLWKVLKDQEGNKDQKLKRAILVQKRDKGDRGQKGDTDAQRLGEMRVTKEILMHEAPRVILVDKGHLVVVVLGLRVLKVTMDEDLREILVVRVQKVTKETPVLKVPKVIKLTVVLEVEMVIKGTLEHRDPNVIKVIEGHRGHLVMVILQTFQLFHNRMELR